MKTAIVYDKWLHQFGGAEMVACTMATILRDNGYEVTFHSQNKVASDEIKKRFGMDFSGIELITDNPSTLLRTSQQPDLFINLSFMDYSYGIGKKNIYYVHFPTVIRPFWFNFALWFLQKIKSISPFIYQQLTTNNKQRIDDRLKAGIFFNMKKNLDSYNLILANSRFTQKWIKNYWNKESTVLYPPVSLHLRGDRNHLGGVKRNWIVSVGRFFTLGHGKKQEVLIEAFKRLTEAVREGNGETASVNEWQLHLVGGIGSEFSSLEFVEKLKQMATGYPIYFHFNVNHDEVIKILSQSKIYWHATGYGENENKNPMAFEHFGIAPVEAIQAGCIPILYDGGGLPEIIDKSELKKEEYLFSTIDELVEKTVESFSKTIKPLNYFSFELFKKNFDRLIE